MNRERTLNIYCICIGVLGWFWLLTSGPNVASGTLFLFVILAILIEFAGFRFPSTDAHSLTGIVLLGAVLALGPTNGALIAAVSSFLYGILYPLLLVRTRSFSVLISRPLLRSGVRAIAILSGAMLARNLGLAAGETSWPATSLLALIPCYVLIVYLSRLLREYLQGGQNGLSTWWRSSWSLFLFGEVAPLPLAALVAAIYTTLGISYFLLCAAALLAASIAVRQAIQNLRRQRRSVAELALLNEASRSIIRSELDVDALCDLIYRQASKVVDTSSFHLGLFDAGSDTYTLMVRVQDRMRLPRLSVDLPAGDGIVGWMRKTGRALLVEDFEREMDQLPARPRYQSKRPPRSGIYVPLLNGETVIGSISVQSYRPHAFETEDMRLLSLIADQAAIAIAKARVYNAARELAVQLQAIHEVSERITAILDLDELLPSVVRLIREHFGYHPVSIYTLDADQNLTFRATSTELQAAVELPLPRLRLGQGLIGTAAQQGQPVRVADVLKDSRYISDSNTTRSEMVVPLRFGDQVIGVLDLQSEQLDHFSEDALSVMQTMADQIAVAIESARAFTAQREEAWTLNALLQVAENISHTSSLQELATTVVRITPLMLGCERCYLLTWDAEQGTLTPRAAYGLTEAQRSDFLEWPFSIERAPLLGDVLTSRTPISIEDAHERRYLCPPILEKFGGKTLLVLPLWLRGTTLGLLITDFDSPHRDFSEREMTLYLGISNQVAVALESELLAQEVASAVRMEEELQVARGVQTAVLPTNVPPIAGWDAAADWRSARMVGGDFFDYWWLDRHEQGSQQRLGFVIADVSDKGVSAAMFMMLSRSLVRAAALHGAPPAVALTRANRWITRDSESAMFVTLFYGIIEPESGLLTYCCAGHNPPMLVRNNGEITELSTPGIALGVLEDAQLNQAEITMLPGDVLVCYTDGITEGINESTEPFGTSRLMDIIRAQRTNSAAQIVTAITSSLFQFTNGAIFDDVTLLIIKRLARHEVSDLTQRVIMPAKSDGDRYADNQEIR